MQRRSNSLSYFLTLSLLFICTSGKGQKLMKNPSFEDEPADATMPSDWFSCNRGTTPDILPGYWGVYTRPSDGQSYIGLITREDGSYEAIGQRLLNPLVEGECYEMSVDLSYSDVYAGYNSTIKLKVYLGEKKCKRDQEVYASPIIKSEQWQTFKFSFTPNNDMSYILIVAYDDSGKKAGNMLIDHLTQPGSCRRAISQPGRERTDTRL